MCGRAAQQNDGTLERTRTLTRATTNVDQFEYVMVLVSIIVGLSIAHVLFGVGGIIDRRAGGPGIKLGPEPVNDNGTLYGIN